MWHKHEAAVELLLQAMIAAGMDIDAWYEHARDDDDAEQGQQEYTGYLLGQRDNGSDSNARQLTLLMRASALGLTSVVRKLLALGADVSAEERVLSLHTYEPVCVEC